MGMQDGKFVRKSLDTRNLERAATLIRGIEDGSLDLHSVKMKEACHGFIEDCKARNMSEGMVRKYKNVCKELEEVFVSPRRVLVEDLRKLRGKWELAPITKQKRLEMVRRFFGFCVDSGWIRGNPAKGVKSSVADYAPTMPYSKEEIERILWAADTVREIHPKMPAGIEKKLRALILLMLHSGVRISDAVLLHKDRIKNGKLFLRQAKTKHPVWVPLPKIVLLALKACDEGDSHYFYNGAGKAKTAITEWQARLKNIYTIAGIVEDGYKSHRLRDTFATSLLEKGVNIETVSMLLGHQSIAITQKHYNPWIQSRQAALEDAVKRTWV
jgi:integrase/recombinase XerD